MFHKVCTPFASDLSLYISDKTWPLMLYYYSYQQNTMVSRALSCITRQLDSIQDSYTMALVTYTLTLANHSDAQKMMKLLKNKAVKTGKIEITSEGSSLVSPYNGHPNVATTFFH